MRWILLTDKRCIDISRYSKEYLSEHNKDFSFESILSDVRRGKVVESLKKYSPSNIVEIGCGLVPIFCEYPYFKEYYLVEPSEEFINNAKNLAKNRQNITLIQDYFENAYQKIRALKIDFIIASSLLHEVHDPEKLLTSIKDLCNPNTIVHINVPNVYSFHRLLAKEMGIIKDTFDISDTERKFQRSTRFDKKIFLDCIESSGFSILSFGTYFIKPFNNSQMEYLLTSEVADLKIIEGLNRMTKYLPEMGCEMFAEIRLR
jgi:SAM-dependent methyltransferase